MRFFSNCVNWPRYDVHADGGLCDMIQERQSITLATFRRNVEAADFEELQAHLGYAPHCPGSILRISRDFLVQFYKSKLHGQTVYYFNHSAIEFVFTPNGSLPR